MAVNTVQYRPTLTADTNRHPSPAIWGDFPSALVKERPDYGLEIFEDFKTFGRTEGAGTTAKFYQGDVGIWKSYEDTSTAIVQSIQSTPDVFGVVKMTTPATAHKACILELGGSVAYSSGSAAPFMYTDGVGGKLYYEARVKVTGVVASTNQLFFGLSQSGVAVVPAAATSITTLFDSASAVGNVDLLGFDVLNAAPTILRGVYGKTSSARTSVGTAQTLASGTWYKIGFIIDPQTYLTNSSLGRKKMRWFIDGLEVQSLTDTLTSPFPTAKTLTPAIHVQTGTTGIVTVEVDFVRVGQLYVS